MKKRARSSGDAVVIRCAQIELTQWRILIHLRTHSEENEYFLWRVAQSIGKRVWNYYFDECVDRTVDKNENDKVERFIQKSIALDEDILRKFKLIKAKWTKAYRDKDEEINIDLTETLKNISIEMYALFLDYKQKQSKIQ